MDKHMPMPWELIEATEHHGAYVVNSWGRTVCDLYAMSNPMAASVRNGGTSFPVHFDDMAANAAFIVKAVNSHDFLVKALQAVIDAACDYLPPDGIGKDEFINRVLAATDNSEFNAAFIVAALPLDIGASA